MSCQTIIYRELKAAAFRAPWYYLRSMVGLTGSVIALGTMLGEFYQRVMPGSAGTRCLELFAGIGALFVTFAGTWATSDSLIAERKENTLGLLFLTDLRAIDIVLGKMAVGVVGGFWSLLAATPALCLTFLLGGVSLDQVLMVFLSLGNLLFFSASLGMLGAVLVQDDRRAASLAMLMAVAVLLLLPAAIVFFLPPGSRPYWQQILLWSLPASAVIEPFAAVGPYRPSTAKSFFTILAVSHALGWGILAVAAWRLSHYRHELEPEVPFRQRWALLRRQRPCRSPRRFGSEADRPMHPILCLAQSTQSTRFYVWTSFGMVFGIVSLLLMLLNLKDQERLCMVALATLVLHAVLKYETAGCACRAASEAVTSGLLTLILLTPVTVDQIIRGYLVSVKRQLGTPLAMVVAIQIVWITIGIARSEWLSQFDPLGITRVAVTCLGLLALNLILLTDQYVLAWHGFWAGLSIAKNSVALRQTMMRVIGLPWLVFLGTVVLWRGMAMQYPRLGTPGAVSTVVWLVAVMAMSNLYWCAWSMHQTRENLRQTVADKSG